MKMMLMAVKISCVILESNVKITPPLRVVQPVEIVLKAFSEMATHAMVYDLSQRYMIGLSSNTIT